MPMTQAMMPKITQMTNPGIPRIRTTVPRCGLKVPGAVVWPGGLRIALKIDQPAP